ncbi:GlxA family transcriptional regulator [Chryseobacterium sp. MIQD13]|uniref:GlxA family transcriptional regulator n=1 Tax=Chryseobacterium sp. MIQD13 TaxID=3422310 RepID=UPI003D296116
MKSIYFLLPDGLIRPSALFNAIEVFEKANVFLRNQGLRDYYKIKIVGYLPKQELTYISFKIETEDIRNLPDPDLIIIPAVEPANNYGNKKNTFLKSWVIEQYNKGTEVASLCTGIFFLAETGLLNHKECTTHWMAKPILADLFPDLQIVTDKIITEQNGIYTAGGGLSSSNLILHIVEKYNGRETALFCAKLLAIDIERNTQSGFAIFEGQKNHVDKPIKNIQDYIENNIEIRITVEFLAENFAMSKRTLIRRFKAATGNTPIEYIQRIKVERAKRELETNRKTVNEIMYAVGYTDNKAFRNIFKKNTGLSPIDYRKKFNA